MGVCKGRQEIQAAIANHRATASYEVDMQIGDIELPAFWVENGVLRPDTMTSRPFAEYVWRQRALYQGKAVTDMMSGCGILGIVAALAGANRVLLSDFSPYAYACGVENVRRYGLGDRVQVVQCDLFDNPRHGSADVIICNAPFSSDEPEPGDYLAAAFLGGTRLIHRFFGQARQRLSRGGSLLMAFRKSAGELNDPGIQGYQHGFRIVDEEELVTPYGVQFGGPLTFYRLMC